MKIAIEKIKDIVTRYLQERNRTGRGAPVPRVIEDVSPQKVDLIQSATDMDPSMVQEGDLKLRDVYVQKDKPGKHVVVVIDVLGAGGGLRLEGLGLEENDGPWLGGDEADEIGEKLEDLLKNELGSMGLEVI